MAASNANFVGQVALPAGFYGQQAKRALSQRAAELSLYKLKLQDPVGLDVSVESASGRAGRTSKFVRAPTALRTGVQEEERFDEFLADQSKLAVVTCAINGTKEYPPLSRLPVLGLQSGGSNGSFDIDRVIEVDTKSGYPVAYEVTFHANKKYPLSKRAMDLIGTSNVAELKGIMRKVPLVSKTSWIQFYIADYLLKNFAKLDIASLSASPVIQKYITGASTSGVLDGQLVQKARTEGQLKIQSEYMDPHSRHFISAVGYHLTSTLVERFLTPSFQLLYGTALSRDSLYFNKRDPFLRSLLGEEGNAFPVQMIFMEGVGARKVSQDLQPLFIIPDTGHGNFWDEQKIFSFIVQMIAALSVAQKIISFTHNDLNIDNVTWEYTPDEYLYFERFEQQAPFDSLISLPTYTTTPPDASARASPVDGATYKSRYFRVPTFNRLYKIVNLESASFRDQRTLNTLDSHALSRQWGDELGKRLDIHNRNNDLQRLLTSFMRNMMGIKDLWKDSLEGGSSVVDIIDHIIQCSLDPNRFTRGLPIYNQASQICRSADFFSTIPEEDRAPLLKLVNNDMSKACDMYYTFFRPYLPNSGCQNAVPSDVVWLLNQKYPVRADQIPTGAVIYPVFGSD